MRSQTSRIAFATICGFAGIATTFVGYYDLRAIIDSAGEATFTNYLSMVGVSSLGLAMLCLCLLLMVRKNWAGFVAITFIGIAVVAFTIGAFKTNFFLGISLVAGLVFVVGLNLRSGKSNRNT